MLFLNKFGLVERVGCLLVQHVACSAEHHLMFAHSRVTRGFPIVGFLRDGQLLPQHTDYAVWTPHCVQQVSQ